MKNTFRLIGIIAVAALIGIALIACGGGKKEESASGSSGGSSSSGSSSTAAASKGITDDLYGNWAKEGVRGTTLQFYPGRTMKDGFSGMIQYDHYSYFGSWEVSGNKVTVGLRDGNTASFNVAFGSDKKSFTVTGFTGNLEGANGNYTFDY